MSSAGHGRLENLDGCVYVAGVAAAYQTIRPGAARAGVFVFRLLSGGARLCEERRNVCQASKAKPEPQ